MPTLWCEPISALGTGYNAQMPCLWDNLETIMRELHFVFDGDSPNAVFVEVEDEAGRSLCVGQWAVRSDGMTVLIITPSDFGEDGKDNDN